MYLVPYESAKKSDNTHHSATSSAFPSWGNLPLQSYWRLSCDHGLHCSDELVNVRTTTTVPVSVYAQYATAVKNLLFWLRLAAYCCDGNVEHRLFNTTRYERTTGIIVYQGIGFRAAFLAEHKKETRPEISQLLHKYNDTLLLSSNRSFYPTTSAVPSVSFLVLYPIIERYNGTNYVVTVRQRKPNAEESR